MAQCVMNLAVNARHRFNPWLGYISQKRKRQPTPVLLFKNPMDREEPDELIVHEVPKESDMTELRRKAQPISTFIPHDILGQIIL